MTGTEAYLYHVMRTTEVPKMGEDTEVRASFWTLEEANAAVRRDLLKEHKREWFTEYEEDDEEEDGVVKINATCPEGETMTVYVEKKPAPPGPAPTAPTAHVVPNAKNGYVLNSLTHSSRRT